MENQDSSDLISSSPVQPQVLPVVSGSNVPQGQGGTAAVATPANPYGVTAGQVIQPQSAAAQQPYMPPPQPAPVGQSQASYAPSQATQPDYQAQLQQYQPVTTMQPQASAYSQAGGYPSAPQAQATAMQPIAQYQQPNAGQPQPVQPPAVPNPVQQAVAVQQPVPAAPLPAGQPKAYSYNSQMVWRHQHRMTFASLLPVVAIIALVAGLIIYWLSIGSPTELEKVPFVQFLLEQ